MKSDATQSPDSLGSPSGYAAPAEADYYAVYVQRGPKARANFLLHVNTTGGKAKALKIARDQGHKLPRWSYAVRVGKEGYYKALRQSFFA